MKHINASHGIRFQNSVNCTVIEYPFENETDINSAVVELNGRYPDNGLSLNEVCKEIVYVIEGSGTVSAGDAIANLHSGDMVRIESHEPYYFEGAMKLLISSSPAWYPDQYKNV